MNQEQSRSLIFRAFAVDQYSPAFSESYAEGRMLAERMGYSRGRDATTFAFAFALSRCLEQSPLPQTG